MRELHSLFDLLEPEKPQRTEAPKENPAGDWCLVYLTTEGCGFQGNLFILHQEDAMKLCSDECSHGVGRGGKWMFQWTSLSHFYDSGDRSAADRTMRDTQGKLEPFVFVYDTGKQDPDFKRLGIQKPGLKEMCDLLRSLGYCFEFADHKQEDKAHE